LNFANFFEFVLDFDSDKMYCAIDRVNASFSISGEVGDFKNFIDADVDAVFVGWCRCYKTFLLSFIKVPNTIAGTGITVFYHV
jgi:hypothetical protein